MNPIDIYLVPGSFVLGAILNVFQVGMAQDDPMLFMILAGFISWPIWIVLIKGVWFVTLRLLGFA